MKKTLAIILALCMVIALGATAFADFPEKTISFIVPYAAGDGLDLTCRAMLENIDLPVNTLVENITGASGTIGLQEAYG